MSKRRVFDINFPADPAPVPAGTPEPEATEKPGDGRRGPMATAISENAGALRARAEAEKNIRAENDRLAHEFVRLKKLGLVVDRIPLDRVSMEKLVRDRSASRDPELEELKESIKAVGLSNPIRVEETDDGYELVQGFRRFQAYGELYRETGDERYAEIPAGLVARGETLQGLYRRMVDENLVRRDISFAEMAQLALNYAADEATGAHSVEEAVNMLYGSAGRQKRVYIRHFATVLDAVGGLLAYPEAIPRALGLDVRKRLGEDEAAARTLRAMLERERPPTTEGELALLRRFADDRPKPAAKAPAAPRPGVAKTTLRCSVPAGTVRCQARDGKIEMAMDRDFSEVERHKLEEAIAAFFRALEED